MEESVKGLDPEIILKNTSYVNYHSDDITEEESKFIAIMDEIDPVPPCEINETACEIASNALKAAEKNIKEKFGKRYNVTVFDDTLTKKVIALSRYFNCSEEDVFVKLLELTKISIDI